MASTSSPVVYGNDDRIELYQATDERLQNLAKANVIALMTRDTVRIDGPSAMLAAPPLGDVANLCPGEPFADQPAAAVCSGILLDAQTVLTASHCIRAISCDQALFVFGYFLAPSGAQPGLKAQDVYGCQEVIAQSLSPTSAEERLDYAWVRLDRPVLGGAMPVAFRPASQPLQAAENVTVLGFSNGTPMKVIAGGRVADARPQTLDYFITTSDTSHGDSGAPVFDSMLRLVGIQARGNPDFAVTAAGCNTVSRLPDDPRAAGEQSTYVDRALEDLCGSTPDSALCCAEKEVCVPSTSHAHGSCSLGAGPDPAQETGTSLEAGPWLLLLGLGASRRRAKMTAHFPSVCKPTLSLTRRAQASRSSPSGGKL